MTAAAFRFGEFTFDCESRQLLQNGEKRHLSPKAQQLLHLLLTSRPRALSREDLYDALWPSTFVGDTNLANLVNELRRALGDEARTPRYIRTAHGYGYAFCDDVAVSTQALSATAMLRCDGAPGLQPSSHVLYEGENAVGRGLECEVVIADSTVSRRHAVITVASGKITVADHGSKNGTFVDGQRIGSTPVPVTPRSRIMFGIVGARILRRRSSVTQSVPPETVASHVTAETPVQR